MAASPPPPGGHALGVLEVEVQPREWPPLSLLLPFGAFSPLGTSHRSTKGGDTDAGSSGRSLQIARRWGLVCAASADGTGAVEVVWSKAPGVRAGDVVLAVDGQAVPPSSCGPAEVEKRLLLRLLLESDDNSGSSSSTSLRLTLDTTKGWGVSTATQREQQRLLQGGRGGWGRFAHRWVLDGYERLLDARCCPHKKLALHALALALLYPVIESGFQSTNTLSLHHGPLVLLAHPRLLGFERLWSLAFVLAATALGLAAAFPRRPRLAALSVGGSALLLHALLLTLLLPPAITGLTLLTSGFVLPPPPAADDPPLAHDDELEAMWAMQDELSALLAHVLCALMLPLLACAYLRRLAAFCDAYAALLRSGRNPRLLALTMPLSAHFVAPAPEERERFLALRACGY